MDVIERYDKEVQPIKVGNSWTVTRASKEVRYAHFEWDKANNTSIVDKERRTIDLLKMALSRVEKPVVSCSFGIDSIVTLYLTRKALVELGRDPSDIDVIWNDTLNEFPEVRSYAKQLEEDWNLRLLVYKPKKPLKKIIDDNGGITSDYFTARKGSRSKGVRPLSEKCCGTLKHQPMKRAIRENKWDLVINGLRADESRQRLLAGLRDGEFFYSSSEWKALTVRPLLWWNELDIWQYVETENIPYNALYDKNIIRFYPDNNEQLIEENEEILVEVGLDLQKLREQQIQTITHTQAIVLKSIGYTLFTPRTGCQMCPIPVKYGYLQFMRLHYPKAYNAMIHTLGYGPALINMVPDDVKAEIKALTGIEMTVEEAANHLKEILEAKPCTFDSFD